MRNQKTILSTRSSPSVPADTTNRNPGHRALRKGRVSTPGQIYLLTTATANRASLFANHRDARIVSRHTHDPDSWPSARLLSWVLMPDHWHGLLQLGNAANLSTIMNRWKSSTSRALHRNGHTGRVWARGFHDHALRREEDVVKAARYIIANPRRAGLVESARQYPYWNSVWLD